MPIGYDTGAGGRGGYVPNPAAAKATWDRVQDWWTDTVEDVIEAVYGWVERVERIAEWVLVYVAQVYPVEFYRFQTAHDERTCPECGAYDGAVWGEDDGPLVPLPPIHVNCRCIVAHAWTEWRTRWVEDWRLEWRRQSTWEWKVTGWQ